MTEPRSLYLGQAAETAIALAELRALKALAVETLQSLAALQAQVEALTRLVDAEARATHRYREELLAEVDLHGGETYSVGLLGA